MGKGLVQDPSKCLRELHYKSLLNYDTHTQRYRYHQLIKKFFTHVPNKYEGNKLRETFLHQFVDYYRRLSFMDTYESLQDVFHLLDKERSNFDFIFTRNLEINPHHDLESIAVIAFNSTFTALQMLHICKSLHSRNPVYRTRVRLELMKPKLYIGSAELVVDIRESQHDMLQDQQDPLFNLAHIILWQSEDLATFHFCLLIGDIHGATLMGIHMGQQGLSELDSDFPAISMYTGLSAYLERYVKLLVQLSKLEAMVHGRQNAVETLLMRYDRVAELFSLHQQTILNARRCTLSIIQLLHTITFSLSNLIIFYNIGRKLLK